MVAQFLQDTIADGSMVVRVVGEVDVAVLEDLRAAVRPCLSACDVVAVDLSGVEFIDSSGLGALVQLMKEAGRQDVAFTLTGVRPPTYRLLELTGLTSIFDIRSGSQAADNVIDA